MSCLQELLELGIGHWIFVDIERLDMHLMHVVAAGRILPRILHVHTNVIATLDHNADGLELEIGFRDPHHAGGRGIGAPGRGNLDELLWEDFPFMGKCRESRAGELVHFGE